MSFLLFEFFQRGFYMKLEDSYAAAHSVDTAIS